MIGKVVPRLLLILALVGLVACSSGNAAPAGGEHQPAADLRPYHGLPMDGARAGAMPAFVTPELQDVYQFAVDRPDALSAVPCYCGCGLTAGHTSNLSCFIAGVDEAGQVVYEEHASYCEICVEIARDTRALLAEGKSLPQVREIIDQRHGEKGPGTNTPRPAAGS